jgi:hypothetical protein
LAAIPERVAREYSVLPLDQVKGRLKVALPDDAPDDVIEELSRLVLLQIDVERANRSALSRMIDIHYRALGSVVQNCPRAFLFRCSKRWADLDCTSQTQIRYCDTCRTNVRLCEVGEELDLAVSRGECVAFYESSEEFLGLIIDDDD